MRNNYIIILLALFLIFLNCRNFYEKEGWTATPFPIMDKYEQYRAYLLYLPEDYQNSNKLVLYFVGSKCTDTGDYFGNQPEHMLFMEKYADKHNFIFAVPFPIYEYTHMNRTCYGWVMDKEIDFVDRLVFEISSRIFQGKELDIYVLGLSAGGYMAYYYAYIHNDEVQGVFSHGKGSEALKEMIDDSEDINWRLGLAYNKYDFPDIIPLVEEDYEYYKSAGLDIKIWRDCDENRHSWSSERTSEYLDFVLYGNIAE